MNYQVYRWAPQRVVMPSPVSDPRPGPRDREDVVESQRPRKHDARLVESAAKQELRAKEVGGEE